MLLAVICFLCLQKAPEYSPFYATTVERIRGKD